MVVADCRVLFVVTFYLHAFVSHSFLSVSQVKGRNAKRLFVLFLFGQHVIIELIEVSFHRESVAPQEFKSLGVDLYGGSRELLVVLGQADGFDQRLCVFRGVRLPRD